ncbi:S-adenosyl-L-methionine-dependent methyltransferase [Cadophora sp. DSE1049]|nr:S-adenosyl-L-methionine-dependent methyltransferase [Cadophora sp. DSE1049]
MHGRKYHSYPGGEYLLPNDEREMERLDLQHELFKRTLDGRLHVALLPSTHRVLDMGTGTGIWAMEFADRNPMAVVYGIDLSPIQPNWVPPNCKFQIDNLSLPWEFDVKFDFIHGRSLFHSFSDPLHIFREAFRTLADGGILEIQDVIFDFRSPDDSLKGSALEEWSKKLEEAFESRGIDLTCVSSYRNYFEEVGFEDIQQEEFAWPVGTWPKARGHVS